MRRCRETILIAFLLVLSATVSAGQEARREDELASLAATLLNAEAEPTDRLDALDALSARGPEAVGVLLHALEQEVGLEREIWEALVEVGPGDGRAFLEAIQRHPHGGFGFEVVMLLDELGPAAVPAAPAALAALACPYSHETGEFVRGARDALVAMGPAVSPQLEAALDDPRPAVRHWVCDALGRLGPAATVRPLLCARFADEDPCARQGAVTGLAELLRQRPPRELVDALGPALVDPDPGVRGAAVWALCVRFEEDPPALGRAFQAGLHDPAASVRDWALTAIEDDQAADPHLLVPLVDAALHADARVRERVQRSLFHVGEQDQRAGRLRWWVVLRAYGPRALVVLALCSSWLLVAARVQRRRALGPPGLVARLLLVSSGPLILACGAVLHVTTREWAQGFLPRPPHALLSFSAAATLSIAVVTALAALWVCLRQPRADRAEPIEVGRSD